MGANVEQSSADEKRLIAEWKAKEDELRAFQSKIRFGTGLLEVLDKDRSGGGVFNVPDVSIKMINGTLKVIEP